MKTYIRNPFIVPALIAGIALTLAGRVTAQTFTTLHSFTATNPQIRGTNNDGASPNGLFLSGSTLYGTAHDGGSAGAGTVFAINTDGTGFTTLYGFTAGDDAGYPYAGLILSGDTLYGATYARGSGGAGTVFAVNTDGTGFTTLYSFSNGSDGGQPEASLILSGNTLYGTASRGGNSEAGTVFAVNIDGTGFATLHYFTGFSGGASPQAGLILSGNTLYGKSPEPRPPSRRSGALARREGRRGERKDEAGATRSFVPEGTRFMFAPQPSDESLGYSRASLRDVESRPPKHVRSRRGEGWDEGRFACLASMSRN